MTSNIGRSVLSALYRRVECRRSRRLSSAAVEVTSQRPWRSRNTCYRRSAAPSSPSFGTCWVAAREPCHSARWYSGDANPNNQGGGSLDRLNFSIFDVHAADIDGVEVWKADDLALLVDQLEELETLTYADMQPLIRPLIRACERIKYRKESAADLAERILFNCLARLPSDIAERFNEDRDSSDPTTLLPYPDHAIYSKVMSIIGKIRSEDAANRVNRLFRLMTAEHRAEFLFMAENGISPDKHSIRAAEPNTSNFKSLLRAWCTAGSANASKEAENVLIEMEELSGLRHVNPTELSGRSYVIAPPDVACYNMVLSAYSRVDNRRHPLVFDRARALFRRMQQLEQNGNFKIYRNT